MKELNLQQRSPEWLDWRRKIIGGSDAPVIMQVNPWKNRMQLWEEKIGFRENSPVNRHMQRGIDLEPEAVAFLSNEIGIELEPIVSQHSEIKWMGASVDAISKDRKIAAEIKCPFALHIEVPKDYYPQLQHIMEVCELDEIIYLSFVKEYGKADGHIFTVKRNDSYIKEMKKAEEEFFGWVETFAPPPQPYQERNDLEWRKTAEQWKDVTFQIKYLEKQEDSLRKSLIELSGGLNSKGGNISLRKEVRKGTVDYKSIPELEKVNLENYRNKPIECWKITHDRGKNTC